MPVIYKALHTGNKNPWSREEMQYILDHHKENFVEELAVHLGRTVSAVKGKAHAMGCSIKSKGIK